MHPLSEVKYRYLKWKINRVRKKFDVYSGGRAERLRSPRPLAAQALAAELRLTFIFLVLRPPPSSGQRERRPEDRQSISVGQKAVPEQRPARDVEVQRHEKCDKREQRRPETGHHRQPRHISPSGTSRAKIVTPGIATRCRYQ